MQARQALEVARDEWLNSKMSAEEWGMPELREHYFRAGLLHAAQIATTHAKSLAEEGWEDMAAGAGECADVIKQAAEEL